MTFHLCTEAGDLIQFTTAAEMFEHVLASIDDGEVHQITRARRNATLSPNARDSRGGMVSRPAPAQPGREA